MKPTPWDFVLKLMRDVFIISREHVLFHYAFYAMIIWIEMLQTSFSSILCWKTSIFPYDEPITGIWRVVSFIWRFGACWKTEESFSITFTFLFVCYVAFAIPLFTGCVWYWAKGYLPVVLSHVILFCHEFLYVLAGHCLGPQIGALIGSMIQFPDMRTGYHIAQTIVYLLFCCIDLWFTAMFVYSSVIYSKGRCMAWASHAYTNVIVMIRILQAVATALDVVEGVAFYTISGVYLLGVVMGTLTGLYIEPMINEFHVAFEVGFLVASGFLVIMEMIIYAGVKMDVTAISIAFPCLGGIATTGFLVFMKRRTEKILEDLKAFDEGNVTFDKCFGNSLKFIRMVRVGFYHASPCVLKWKPFGPAMDKWPNDERIWIQYLRFVALFHDQNVRLTWLIDVLKQRTNRSFLVNNSIFQAKRIKKSRSRIVTPEIKRCLADIGRKSRQITMLNSGFWRAVEECSYSTMYDVSLSLWKLELEIESEYRRLVNLYPNNPLVCQRYAYFLRERKLDPFQARQWFARAAYLNGSKSCVVDVAQEQGSIVFPLISTGVASSLVGSKLGSYQMMTEDFGLRSDTGPSQSEGHGSRSDSQATSSTADEMADEQAFRRSSYAEMGKKVPVKPIRNMIIILVFLGIVCIFGAFFVFSILSSFSYETFADEFRTVRFMGYLADEMGVALFEIYRYSLQCDGVLLSEDEVAEHVPKKGVEPIFSSVWIQEIANALESAATNVQQAYRQYQEKLLASVELTNANFLNMSVVLVNGRSATYSADFLEAMNGIASRICSFDGTVCKNSDKDPWFIYLQENTWNFVLALESIARTCCYSMNAGIDDVNSQAKIFVTVFLIILVVCVVFFFLENRHLQHCWSRVVHVVHSIPKIVIRNQFRPGEIGHDEDDATHQEEDRYANIFIQCVASRETSGGLPVQTTQVYVIVISVLLVAGLTFLVLITGNQNSVLVSLPIRYEATSRLIGNLMAVMQSVERTIAAYHDSPYRNDTYESMLEELDSRVEIVKDNLRAFEFGQWEDIQIGCLSSDPVLIQWILDDSKMTNWVDEPYEHDRIESLPTLITLNLVVQMFNDASFVGGNISKTNHQVLVAEHFGVTHLMLDLIRVLMDNYAESVKDRVSLMNATLYSMATGLVVVCSAIVVILTLNLTRIRSVFRQCITLVAHIDPEHIADSPALEGLFDGDFAKPTGTRRRNIGSTLVKYELLPDLVVILDQTKTITHINKSALDAWGGDCIFCVDKDISTLMTFNHVFGRYLDDVVQYQRAMVEPMDIEYKIVATGRTYSSSVRVFSTSGDKERTIVIMIRADEVILEKQSCYEELEAQLTKMKKSALPMQLRDEIMVDRNNTFTSSNTVIMAVQCPDILVHQKAVDLPKLQHALSVLREGVARMIHESTDAALWKSLGDTRFVCFNIRCKALNIHNVITESIRAAKLCYDEMKAGHCTVKIAMTQCKKMIVGWISSEMNFGIYSKQVARAYSLVNKAADDCLLTTIKTCDFLPSEVNDRATTVEYNVKKSATQIHLSWL